MSLGPLAARVPPALLAGAAYHVPRPPNIVAKLDANELPYPLPPELRGMFAAALAEVDLHRYPDPNATKLRAIVAAEHGVAPEQLTFGNGSDELIALLINAFAGPVLYPSPSFVYYKLAAIARGVPTVEVPLSPRFELDEPAVHAAIARDKPSVVFLALPNNPTGTLWRMDFALELAARYRDTVIVSDEAYAAYSGKSNLDALASNPNLVVMRTLSKLGLAGLRVGYTLASPAIAALLEKVRPPYNLSSLDQRAAELMLVEGRDWCAARAKEVVAQRAVLAAGLAKHGEVFPSEANLLLVRFTDARATWQKLADAGVLVRLFDAGPLAGCLRITVGTPEENARVLSSL